MPIKKASELDFSNKKIKMIIAGYPGIGKSTLALSAPDPLLIDVDEGIDRVEAPYRKDTLVVENYEGLLEDFEKENFDKYKTFVFDTGGKLLDIIKPYVIKKEPKNGQRDGSLSQKGWGAVAMEFKRISDLAISLGKHIVFVFHAKEETDGEMTKLRIAIEGSSKNKIWEIMDLGGFVEIQGKKRVIGFSNTERYYAKGTHGIKGTYEIPELTEGVENNFLTNLFGKILEDLQNDAKKYNEEQTRYEELMGFKVFIENANDLEQVNQILVRILEIDHVLTSERELKTHLIKRAKELGFEYDKETKKFIQNNS